MNKVINFLTVIVILGLIVGFSVYKVINNYNEKVLLVESKYIIEKAKDCLNQKKCSGDTITLKTLYDSGFLSKQVNGVTKEYYNESSYVLKKENNYQFVIVD